MIQFRFRFAACALFAAALVGLVQPSSLAQEKTGKVEKKTYEFKDAKKDMEYALFVPGAYDKEKKWPVIIALHGLGGNPQQFIKTRSLTAEADKRGYIVAAPMGYNERGWYGQPVLKIGAKKGDPEDLRELSEKDVMNVLGIVKKEYNVDPDRVYLMGHSMGGGGTLHLAIKFPDEWAALGPIAPAIFAHKATEAEKIKHIPVIMVQGAKDLLVRPELVRPWADQMKKLEMTYEYIEVPDGDHGNVVGPNVPKIYDFFDMHTRKKKPGEKNVCGDG
jgi:poly(3-hydroxybutyrate) depolymerase